MVRLRRRRRWQEVTGESREREREERISGLQKGGTLRTDGIMEPSLSTRALRLRQLLPLLLHSRRVFWVNAIAAAALTSGGGGGSR